MKFLNAKDCVSIDIMMTTNITETDVRKRQDDDLPQLGPMKFGMFNSSENRQGSQTCGCVPRGSTSGYGSQCSEGGEEGVD